jgi:hypothetical protein
MERWQDTIRAAENAAIEKAGLVDYIEIRFSSGLELVSLVDETKHWIVDVTYSETRDQYRATVRIAY